jgi:WD40 repeat protein
MSNYDVFISYSRKDTDFVRQLFSALEAQKRGAWVDWQGIDYSTKWWEEICAGIDNADNFVLILSPQSLNSLYCHREIEYARVQGKRIIPFIYQTIDEALLVGGWYASTEMRPIETLARTNWEYLKSIQWIDFPKLGDFGKAYAALVETIDSDPEHVKLHTRLLQSAAYWERAGRNPDALLRGADLRAAEEWLTSWDGLPDNNKLHPKPTEAQRGFITACRAAEDDAARLKAEQEARTSALEAQTERATLENAELGNRTRRFRLAAAISALVGVIALGATIIALGQTTEARNAEAQANAALTAVPPTLEAVATQVQGSENRIASLDLASEAVEVLNDPRGNPELAALLGIRAINTAYTEQADAALVRATDQLYTRALLSGHRDVSTAAYSPDGRFIVTAGGDDVVRIWDAISGAEIRTLIGHGHRVGSAAYSPDGRFIVTASDDATVRIWDAISGAEIRTLIGHGHRVGSAAYSPDGRFIVTAGGDVVRIWDAISGAEIRTLIGHSDGVNSVAYSPDGRFIVTAGDDATVRIWDGISGAEIRTLIGHGSMVSSAAYSPDGRFIVTAGWDRTARIWDTSNGTELQVLHSSGVILSAVYSPNGNLIVTAGGHKVATDNAVRIWDAAGGDLLRELYGHLDWGTSATFSPDGRYVATTSYDGTVRVWSTDPSADARLVSGLPLGQTSDGGFIVIASGDDPTRVIETMTGTDFRVLRGHNGQVIRAAFNLGGSLIVTDGDDNTLRLWNATTGEQICSAGGNTNDIELSPDGRFILVARERAALILDVPTCAEVHVLQHEVDVFGASYSPDGRFIVTAGDDAIVRIWDAMHGAVIRELIGHQDRVESVSYSPSGEYIISAGDNTVRIWDARNGIETRTYYGKDLSITFALFSPDERHIAVGTGGAAGDSTEHVVRIWDRAADLETRAIRWSTVAFAPRITDILYSADGRSIITYDGGDMARIWDTNYRDFIAYACTRVFRDFTPEERARYGIDDTPTCPQFAGE